MTASESHLNISKGDLRRLDLGTLLRQECVFHDPDIGTRIWEFEFERGTVRKTEWYGEENFLEAAQAIRNDTDGQRFGDNRVVASVPMHVWARDIAPRQKDGNQASLKKWLNASENRAFRTFRGVV